MKTRRGERICGLIFFGAFVAAAACSPNKPHQNTNDSANLPEHHAAHGVHGAHGNHGNPKDLGAYVSHLEDPSRDAWQKPDEVVATLRLGPGAVVCDVGAGPGYFALRLAKAVGAQGRVYAVDVEPRILGTLQQRMAQTEVRNLVPILGLPDDPLLPEGVCDVVLIVNTLHHFPEPVAYLKRLARSLKDDGRIVNIDFHKRPTPMGPPVEARVSADDFKAMAQEAGLEITANHEDLLEHQYFIELVAD